MRRLFRCLALVMAPPCLALLGIGLGLDAWSAATLPKYRIIARDEVDCTRFLVEERTLWMFYDHGHAGGPFFSVEDARKRVQENVQNDARAEAIRRAKWRIVK